MKIFNTIVRTYKDAYSGLPREAWLLSLVELVNRSGTMVFFFMTLYLTQEFGFSTFKAGQVMSAYGFGALLGTYLGGKLTDILGAYTDKPIVFGARPEDVGSAQAERAEGAPRIRARVDVVEPMGNEIFLYFELGGKDLVARIDVRTPPAVSTDVDLVLDTESLHFFDKETGESLLYGREV